MGDEVFFIFQIHQRKEVKSTRRTKKEREKKKGERWSKMVLIDKSRSAACGTHLIMTSKVDY